MDRFISRKTKSAKTSRRMSDQNLTGFSKGDIENCRKPGAMSIEVGRKRDKSRRAGVRVLTAIAVVLLIFPVVTIPILFTLYAKFSSRQVFIQ